MSAGALTVIVILLGITTVCSVFSFFFLIYVSFHLNSLMLDLDTVNCKTGRLNHNVAQLITVADKLNINVDNMVDSIDELKLPVEVESLEVKDTSDESIELNKYYVVCLCTRSNQSKLIRCFTSDNAIEGDISSEDLRKLQENVLKSNSDYQSCEIIFFSKLKG